MGLHETVPELQTAPYDQVAADDLAVRMGLAPLRDEAAGEAARDGVLAARAGLDDEKPGHCYILFFGRGEPKRKPEIGLPKAWP